MNLEDAERLSQTKCWGHSRFLKEHSADGVLGFIFGTTEWEVPAPCFDQRWVGVEIEAGIRQSNLDYRPSVEACAESYCYLRVLLQHSLVLCVVDQVKSCDGVKFNTKCIFEGLANRHRKPEMGYGRVNEREYSLSQHLGLPVRVCHCDALDGDRKLSLELRAKGERDIIRYQPRFIVASNRETSRSILCAQLARPCEGRAACLL